MKTLEDGVVCNFPSGAGALSHLPHIYTVTISDNYTRLQSRLSAGYTPLFPCLLLIISVVRDPHLSRLGASGPGQSAIIRNIHNFRIWSNEVITKFDPRGGPGPVLLIRSRQWGNKLKSVKLSQSVPCHQWWCWWPGPGVAMSWPCHAAIPLSHVIPVTDLTWPTKTDHP